MNLNELKIEFAELKDFEFVAKTAKEAEDATTVPAENFAVPGLYRVLFGSRGFIEIIERVGDDADALDVVSKEEAAAEVPGAKDFLNYAASKGVTIFYITNRVVELKKATQNNLTKLGIPWDQTKETILMRGENNWGSDKGSRRALVAQEYRVLLMAGDNLGDFVDAKDNNLSPQQRKAIVEEYADYWGEKWFMLQNIAYGDWEGALYDFNYSLSPDEVHNTRLESLEPIR